MVKESGTAKLKDGFINTFYSFFFLQPNTTHFINITDRKYLLNNMTGTNVGHASDNFIAVVCH